MTSDDAAIDFDDLEIDPVSELALLNGTPFSGVAIERYDDEHVMSRTEFQDGRRHGVAREWSIDGTLTLEAPYVFDLYHGVVREWFDSGEKMSKSLYELGIRLRSARYDQQGQVLERFELSPTDPMRNMLEKLRAGKLGASVLALGLPLNLESRL